MAVVLGFLVVRIRQYHDYAFKPLWLAEALLFAVLGIAFMVRSDHVDRSSGVVEIIVPAEGRREVTRESIRITAIGKRRNAFRKEGLTPATKRGGVLCSSD